MNSAVSRDLSRALRAIDRPGSFCVSGSMATVLPGLEVEGMGPIGLPLTARQARELKKHCRQAPYGKGEKTLVDTNVRRVWELTPDRFRLTNPEWQPFLQQTVRQVQEGLGLEGQKLQAHLYDLLLYEPGSFFLPHQDGEKLDRMVATLVVVLPSSFQGGELVVRHDGQEQTIDFGGSDPNLFRTHFAAFYADCEHEIRPLREGYRLCLVYNLTLARAKRLLRAPRHSEQIEPITNILRNWPRDDALNKLVIILEHQYTQDGLTWDALKGVDRARGKVLLEAARRADCHAYLALLTLHEAGSAEYAGGGYSGSGGWYDEDEEEEDADDYEMGELYDSSLVAEHWRDSQGHPLPLGTIFIEEDELLDPEALRDIEPEEEFEGYTGNAGMTLDRWYRHGVIVLWPAHKHFDVLCDAGTHSAVQGLGQMVKQWQQARGKDAEALRGQCLDFAARIIARREPAPNYYSHGEKVEPCPLFRSLATLADPGLIRAYLRQVLARDASVDPGKALVAVCRAHGWKTFQEELELVFRGTTANTLDRNLRLLEQLCSAKPRKKEGWAELCASLAPTLFTVLEGIDQEKAANEWSPRPGNVADRLAGFARSLLATEQFELLSRVVAHALARPEKYPLRTAHVPALTSLGPWLKKNLGRPCPALTHWLASCSEQLETLSARVPEAPADWRRTATLSCKCQDCAELKRFLENPTESVHRFRVREDRREHLADVIRQNRCDLDCKTEQQGSPYALVCTKNTSSYKESLKQYHQDREHLAALGSIQASLPK